MADTDTLIGVLADHLIYLLQKNDRWFGRCETWSKAGGGYSFRGPSADTPNKASAQEYAVREFLGLDQEAAKKRNKEIDWRPSAQIIVVRRIPEGRSLQGKSCVRQGCRDPLEYVVEFADAGADTIPEDWPHRQQYFCKGDIKKFRRDRGLPISN